MNYDVTLRLEKKKRKLKEVRDFAVKRRDSCFFEYKLLKKIRSDYSESV